MDDMAAGEPRSQNGPRRRWQSPQPNITGVGLVASYSARFWATLVVIGTIAGLGAAALVAVLRFVERHTYGSPHADSLLAAVQHATDLRRLIGLLLAACVVSFGLWAIGRASTGGVEVTEAIWLRSGRLPPVTSIARGLISIVAIGMGASLGREAAPQLVGATAASSLSDWNDFPIWQRRLLVACGAGAGFAAVYNVPLGGTLVALEVMLGTLALPLVLPALLTSVTATAVAWIFLGQSPVYHVAIAPFQPAQLVFAIVIGPILGLTAVGWTRLVAAANRAKPRGRRRYVVPFIAFAAIGVLSFWYPQLLGNGHAIVQLAILGRFSLGLMLILFLLKPLVTAATISVGCPGGLFTPTFAVGVLLAGAVGSIWMHIWSGTDVGTYALIGGGAFLAAAMQGPLSGTVLVLELTGHIDSLIVPTLVAVIGATVLARRLGAASIYSARLATGEVIEEGPSVYAAAVEALRHPASEAAAEAESSVLTQPDVEA